MALCVLRFLKFVDSCDVLIDIHKIVVVVIVELFEGDGVGGLSGLALGEVGPGSVKIRVKGGDFIDEGGAGRQSCCRGVELGA